MGLRGPQQLAARDRETSTPTCPLPQLAQGQLPSDSSRAVEGGGQHCRKRELDRGCVVGSKGCRDCLVDFTVLSANSLGLLSSSNWIGQGKHMKVPGCLSAVRCLQHTMELPLLSV
jgi:hypothetical protein